jgi:hypothetical protein
MVYKIRIDVDCPKGKSEKTLSSFKNMFSLMNKPIAAAIINDHSFYCIYQYDKYKDLENCINIKIPKAIYKIRSTYWVLIHALDRVYKIASKLKWDAAKINREVMKRINKELKDEPIDEPLTLEGREELVMLLGSEFIRYEIIEDEQNGN